MSLFFLDEGGFVAPRRPGLQLWLDMADTSTITSSGGAVSQINDKSGLGNDFIQGTGSAQPTTGSATINAKNVLSFDGGDYMSRTLSSDIIGVGLTVFVVARRTSAVDSASTLVGVANGQANDFDNAGSAVFFDEGGGGAVVYQTFNNSSVLSNTTNLGNGVPYIIATRFDGTNNTMYLNNVAQTPVACSSTLAFRTLYLCTRYVGSAAIVQYNGLIGEVIIYNRALPAPEISTISRYLSNKWGVAI